MRPRLTVDEARDWAELQRHLYHQGRLEKHKIAKLEATPGWDWGIPSEEVTDYQWLLIVEYFQRQQHRKQCDYQKKTGDHVPYSVPSPNRRLSAWAGEKPNKKFILRDIYGTLTVIKESTVRKLFEKGV
jgi:hypothetical protein